MPAGPRARRPAAAQARPAAYRCTRPASRSHSSGFFTSSTILRSGVTMPSHTPYAMASLGCMYSGRCRSCKQCALEGGEGAV